VTIAQLGFLVRWDSPMFAPPPLTAKRIAWLSDEKRLNTTQYNMITDITLRRSFRASKLRMASTDFDSLARMVPLPVIVL
jgi:hypothetical protein